MAIQYTYMNLMAIQNTFDACHDGEEVPVLRMPPTIIQYNKLRQV